MIVKIIKESICKKSIIDVINGTTHQTNLFALNASIVAKTRQAMDNSKEIVKESNDKLETTVNLFNNIITSSEEVNGTLVMENGDLCLISRKGKRLLKDYFGKKEDF